VEEQVKELQTRLQQTLAEVHKVIIGQEAALEELMVAFLAGGHALLEGVPGLAKTLMVKSLAQTLDLGFNRVQFTPDLMPADIIGTEILQENASSGKKEFVFLKGPLFTNILLADEINRTPPKTQSALLQAMQEHEVTYAGHTYRLDEPFFLVATQNPIEQAGTYTLPEAQLDRFLLYIKVGYPTEKQEFEVLKSTTGANHNELNKVIGQQELRQVRAMVKQVTISDELIQWVSVLTRQSRPQESQLEEVKKYVRWGAGPRAGQAVILCAKALAFLQGRLAVIDADIQRVFLPVMRHRIMPNYQAEAERKDSDQIAVTLLKNLPLRALK
jgi:MoxR-like ATPase